MVSAALVVESMRAPRQSMSPPGCSFEWQMDVFSSSTNYSIMGKDSYDMMVLPRKI